MNNWKDYVGLLHATGPLAAPLHALVFNSLEGSATTLTLSAVPVSVAYTLSDDEVGVEVERLLNTFPSHQQPIDIADHSPDTELKLNKLKNEIARQTRRGVGNTQWNNVVFYRGLHSQDSPIIVVEDDGKYGVFVHPHFEKYGFKVTI